jgi:hypothetical protein
MRRSQLGTARRVRTIVRPDESHVPWRSARARAVLAGLSAGVALAVASGCGQGTPTPDASTPHPTTSAVTPTVAPPRTSDPGKVVARLSQDGGFVPLGWSLVQAPQVVVYSDGRAVANATRVLTLGSAELNELLGRLRTDLDGFGPTVTPTGKQYVADASTTHVDVLDSDGRTHSVSAYALDLIPSYPAALVEANTRLRRLADRVTHDGVAYRAARIRLVAEQRGDTPAGQVRAWPAGVPVPSAVNPARAEDLDPAASAAMIAVVPVGLPDGQGWPVLRTSDGTLLGVAWRYLLPDE